MVILSATANANPNTENTSTSTSCGSCASRWWPGGTAMYTKQTVRHCNADTGICLPIYPQYAKHTPFLCDKHQTRFQPRKAHSGQILGKPCSPAQHHGATVQLPDPTDPEPRYTCASVRCFAVVIGTPWAMKTCTNESCVVVAVCGIHQSQFRLPVAATTASPCRVQRWAPGMQRRTWCRGMGCCGARGRPE